MNKTLYDMVIARQRSIFAANLAAIVVFAGSVMASFATIL